MCDQGHAADLLRAGRDLLGRLEQPGGPQSLQFTLGIPEPAQHAGDALGKLLAGRLELLAELVDQHALPGQEAERVQAHERFDPAHA